MRRFALSVLFTSFVTFGCVATSVAQTQAGATIAVPPKTAPAVPTTTLGDLLSSTPLSASACNGFYDQVPANLEQAVRYVAKDNYSSASEILLSELDKAKDPKERARVLMWIGLARGQEAMDNSSAGWALGTSSTQCLREAISLDPAVAEAPDVMRTLAEMVASGWSTEDPNDALKAAMDKAEKSRKSLDFYYAGVMQRRIAQRAWSYSDTTPMDQKAFSLFAKAVACNPERYESWAAYLPSLMPVGMHDLMATETEKMYSHFKALRCPLLREQGPAALHYRCRRSTSMQDDENYLESVAKLRPDDPFPYYQLALGAIETTPSLAVERFNKFLDMAKSGAITFQPRENGYLVSALYKLGFLAVHEQGTTAALAWYEKVKELSPMYAENNLNIAILAAQMAEKETTGPAKVKWLERAIDGARLQEKYNYRERASQKALQVRRRLQMDLRAVNEELATKKPQASAAADKPKQ